MCGGQSVIDQVAINDNNFVDLRRKPGKYIVKNMGVIKRGMNTVTLGRVALESA